jgi:TrmH family RNA methyltransferase
VNLPAYSEGLEHTYAFGRFAVTEALQRRPADVACVLWHGAMPAAQAEAVRAAAARAGVACLRDDATVTRLRRKANVFCLAQVSKRPERLQADADHVLMLRPSHPGNVGSAIRSMVAFGFLDLALVAPAVDPWGAYVVRASVGLRFALRCQTFDSLGGYLDEFGESSASARTLYHLDAAGQHELDSVRFRSPLALVFGPEWQDSAAGAGPDPRLERSLTVRIPQGNQVESLNLATSISIVTYRASRSALS